MTQLKRNKVGRFERVEISKEVEQTPELSSAEATMAFAENLVRMAENLATVTSDKLAPFMKKLTVEPIAGLDFNVEKYPTYFRNLCSDLNKIYCSLESINTSICSVDL